MLNSFDVDITNYEHPFIGCIANQTLGNKQMEGCEMTARVVGVCCILTLEL